MKKDKVYLIQLSLLAREGEGEAQRKLLLLYVQPLHEVGQAVSNMVEQLQEREVAQYSPKIAVSFASLWRLKDRKNALESVETSGKLLLLASKAPSSSRENHLQSCSIVVLSIAQSVQVPAVYFSKSLSLLCQRHVCSRIFKFTPMKKFLLLCACLFSPVLSVSTQRYAEVPRMWWSFSHLSPTASHQVFRDGIDLVLHLHLLLAIRHDPDQQHSKVRATKVKCQEFPLLCGK